MFLFSPSAAGGHGSTEGHGGAERCVGVAGGPRSKPGLLNTLIHSAAGLPGLPGLPVSVDSAGEMVCISGYALELISCF